MNKLLIGSIAFFLIIVIACTDETGDIINPYDSVDYGDTTTTGTTIDTTSIVGLHHNIFKARCAVPGCHDGAFEPDFRTVQSSYSTLVYHPITKNNAAQEFQYRVVPFDPDKSVLIERLTNCCFVNQNDRMPQDNIGVPLEDHLIASIRLWIENGARDIFDQEAVFPNTEARVLFYVPANETFTVNFGENRLNGYGAFILPQNTVVNMIVAVEDDDTPVDQLINNRIAFSLDPDDFSNATSINSQLITGNNMDQFYLTTFNSSNYPLNQEVYFRVYSNDGEQPTDTEFPTSSHQLFYKAFYSFIVQ